MVGLFPFSAGRTRAAIHRHDNGLTHLGLRLQHDICPFRNRLPVREIVVAIFDHNFVGRGQGHMIGPLQLATLDDICGVHSDQLVLLLRQNGACDEKNSRK